ncbi:MAG: FHA domain-containing protein [Oceanococcus sp.]
MSQLVISIDGRKIAETELSKERITIGRHPSSDIELKDDKAVSGRHAAIITIMKDSFLEDLDSTNGTMVNGRQVGKHPLSNGDTIQIGRHTLKYEGEETEYDEDFEKTMILKPSEIIAATSKAQAATAAPTAAPAANAAAAPAPPSAPARPTMGKIIVDSGPNAGKELKLTKALTTLGKPGVQVAAITKRADAYYVVHVSPAGSQNRPKVNGEMIAAQARKLASGDRLEIAGTVMKFEIFTPVD